MDRTLEDTLNELEDLELEPLSPTIEGILKAESLKWIFVGGKGGVGKTTCSSCIAIKLAEVRESVLLISTDPAHNISDAFNQKFTGYPSLVNGFSNLYAMEIDPTSLEHEGEDLFKSLGGGDFSAIQEIATSIPGIDEAMSFAEVMRQVNSMQFRTIVFDTAPTGHTLRLLSFPSTLQKTFGQMLSLKNKFGGIFSQLGSMLGGGQGMDTESMSTKMEAMKKTVDEINVQFKDPKLTTFIPVCIPEFLSLYETERLIQELAKFGIDVNTLIVNQILYPCINSSCDLCLARKKMQQKYIDQIDELYEDFHIIKLPLQKDEVRGTEDLMAFSAHMVTPFQATD